MFKVLSQNLRETGLQAAGASGAAGEQHRKNSRWPGTMFWTTAPLSTYFHEFPGITLEEENRLGAISHGK